MTERESTMAERELIEAALALDALWIELGSCETAGDAWPATERFISACETVRQEHGDG